MLRLRRGGEIVSEVANPLGDPGHPLGIAEVEAKTARLVRFGGGAPGAVSPVSERVRSLTSSTRVPSLLGPLLEEARVRTAG